MPTSHIPAPATKEHLLAGDDSGKEGSVWEVATPGLLTPVGSSPYAAQTASLQCRHSAWQEQAASNSSSEQQMNN